VRKRRSSGFSTSKSGLLLNVGRKLNAFDFRPNVSLRSKGRWRWNGFCTRPTFYTKNVSGNRRSFVTRRRLNDFGC
jgi:hypothetical protein